MSLDHIHLAGSHSPLLVVISVVIAGLASYAALDLAGRVRSAEGATRLGWLTGGATVMGLGIWSMHFVAMLAFRLQMPIAYELKSMVLSIAVAIGASLLALVVVSRAELRRETLVVGGILMGGAIAGMHYIGMASMRVDAAFTYDPRLVTLSVAIAIVASIGALALAFSFRSIAGRRAGFLKALSAVIMGGAIAGMHYTAMAAVRFLPRQVHPPASTYILANGPLAAMIVIGATVMLALALIGAVIDRNIQAKIEFTRQLTMEHEINLELQRRAQHQAARARWLEGVAATTTALAHEINNPLTALLMNAEMLADPDEDQAAESVEQIRLAARRIAGVVARLTQSDAQRAVAYLDGRMMLDLSGDQRQLPS